MKRIPLLAKIITGLVIVFLYAPLFVLIANSFNSSRLGGHWEGWTLGWYWQLFEDSELLKALQNTLIIAIGSTFASTCLGTLAAFCIRIYRSNLQIVHSLLIYTPLVVPEVHMGISLMLLFVIANLPLGLTTIMIAHTTFCTSYVTMIMLASFEEFDFAIVEAASDLGAGWRTIVQKIMLPLLMPGLVASALLAFTLSIDDFVITFFVAGPGATTLPLHIYSMTKFGSPPLINALSTILLILTFIAAGVSQYFFNVQAPSLRNKK